MSLPDIVSRDEWLAARVQLLDEEKAFTRRHDALNAQRRRLPMVAVEKSYTFDGADGPVTLLDLFDGARQLIVQHVMFAPDWTDPCPGCTAGLDEISAGMLRHVRSRDTAFVAVSRAPFDTLRDAQARKGWSAFTWVSSFGSDFNYDYHVTLDESVAPVFYNYRTPVEHAAAGSADANLGKTPSEQPGYSCFLRDGEQIFHTYSTFARGTDQLGSGYSFLDLTALGRQEDWEEPKGRVDKPHDANPTFTD